MMRAIEGRRLEESKGLFAILRSSCSIASLAVVLPAIVFYLVLFQEALNVPDLDDYKALLKFVNHMAGLQGISARMRYFFAAQHNEYKLFFEHGLVWAQFVLTGHVDFRVLCAIGNGFVLLLAVLLWKLFPARDMNTGRRLMLFVPVSWLIFQFQYVETIDWAMGSLQNLPVLVFSLGGLYLLAQKTKSAFWLAVLCLVLAVASSGNGLIMIPLGGLILAISRRYLKALAWSIISVGCVVAYAYQYTMVLPENPIHFSLVYALIGYPLYFVTFLGSAAAFPMRGGYVAIGLLLCPCLGLFICIFLFVVLRRGYFQRNPLIGQCILFVLASAAMATTGRANGGIWSASSSRYGIYSSLLLIFVWFATVENILPLKDENGRKALLADVIKLAVLFSLTMDVVGWRYMVDRNRELIQGMAAFERSSTSVMPVGPVLPVPHPHPWMVELEREAPVILKQSIRLGIYEPPKL